MGYLRRKKHPWRNGLLIAAIVAPLLYALVGFLVLPPIVKSRAEKELAAVLKRPVHIAKVRLNPFTLAATVEGFDVRERNGQDSFLGWERLFVNFEASSLWNDEWRFAAIEIDVPHGRVVAGADGALNFSDLLETGAAAESAPGTPETSDEAPVKPLHIAHLVLNRARLEFRDEGRAQPFATTLGPVSLVVRDFRTISEANAPYTFEAVTESGEKLSWRGGIRSAPFRSRGELTVSNVVLKKYAPYYAERSGLDIARGLLTVHGRYDFNFDAQQRVIRLLDGALDLRDLLIVERGTGATVLELPRAEIKGATADGIALTADVREVAIEGGRLRVRREKDGTINLLTLLQPPAADPTAGTPPAASGGAGAAENPAAAAEVTAVTLPAPPPLATAAPAIGLTVGEVAVREFALEFEDLVPGTPAKLGAERVHFSLKEFTLGEGAKMPLQLTLDWQPAGAVRLNGTVALQPIGADVQLELDGFALGPLNPYLAEQLNGQLASGLVSLGGRATVETVAGAAPAVTFKGQSWLERFSLVEAAGAGEVAGFSDLVVSGIEVATAPQLTARVAEINLAMPKATVVVNPDRTLNLSRLPKAVAPAPSAAAEPALRSVPPPVSFAAPAPAAADQPVIEVGRVVVTGGQFFFRDESMAPQVQLAVADFGGTISNLSSANPGRGEVDLQAKVGTAPIAIAGRLDALAADPSVDLKVNFRDFDLRPLSPYSGRYAGYELARGRLTLDVQARLQARQLDTENVVTLEDFTFGAATNSPDATQLPVRLGLALLKDREGVAVIDLPVQGDLADPEFRVWRVVGRVFGNILAKAATAPFALLGALVGGDAGDELGWQEFAPGESAVTEAGAKKLEAVARALIERPTLMLALSGGYAPEADADALRRRGLEATLRATWRERALAADPGAVIAVDTAVPEAEFAATVKHVFDRRFPPGSELGTPLPPAPPILAPPSGADRHWVRKVVDWVMNSEERRLLTFRQKQEEIQRQYLEAAKAVVDVGLPVEVMLERLAAAETPDAADLAALASARLASVRDFLVARGVGLERMEIQDTTVPLEPTVAAEVVVSEPAAEVEAPPEGEVAEENVAAPAPVAAPAAAAPRVVLELR